MSRSIAALLTFLSGLVFTAAVHAADGVATFGGAMPSAAQLQNLRSLGLQVQGFQNLPLALLRGPDAALKDAVTRGYAQKVYPNERLQYFSNASNLSIRANEAHAIGIDGTGVTVAVIDSGIDGTHPDLAQRVAHNVKLIESGTPAGNIVVPMEQTPFNNSDTSSGHGTHVAGIIAADNTDGLVKGVAPGAKLVGYGTGEAIFVFGAVAAFDHMISKRAEWGIQRGEQFVGLVVPAVRPGRADQRGDEGGQRRRHRRRVRGRQQQHRDVAESLLRRALGDLDRQRHVEPPAQRLVVGRPGVRQLHARPAAAGNREAHLVQRRSHRALSPVAERSRARTSSPPARARAWPSRRIPTARPRRPAPAWPRRTSPASWR